MQACGFAMASDNPGEHFWDAVDQRCMGIMNSFHDHEIGDGNGSFHNMQSVCNQLKFHKARLQRTPKVNALCSPVEPGKAEKAEDGSCERCHHAHAGDPRHVSPASPGNPLSGYCDFSVLDSLRNFARGITLCC